MEQRIGDTKGVVQLAREQNRIGCTLVCAIGISERPEEYGGYCEADHCRIRAETERPRADVGDRTMLQLFQDRRRRPEDP